MQTIRDLREAAGLSQLQLAVALGVSVSAVYKWESGTNKPRASLLRDMAKLFNISMDEIDFEAHEAKATA